MPKKNATAAPVDEGAEAYKAGQKATETHGVVRATEVVPDAYKAVLSRTKKAYLKDCYFAGIYGEPKPAHPGSFPND